jgi:hypothetical protein
LEQAARRAAIASLLFVCTACSGRLELQVLRAYFDACATGDLTALANGALVWLHPAEDGVVGRFRIVKIDPAVSEAAEANSRAVRLSLHDPVRPHAAADALLVTETVTVSAEMHRGGEIVNRELRVTLGRAETREVVGRWIVLRLAPGGRTLPAASSDQP